MRSNSISSWIEGMAEVLLGLSSQAGERGGGIVVASDAPDSTFFKGERGRAGERWCGLGLRLPDRLLSSEVAGVKVYGLGREWARVISGAESKAEPRLRDLKWLREYGLRFLWLLLLLLLLLGRAQSDFSLSRSQPCRRTAGLGLGSVLLRGLAGRVV